MYIPSGLDYAPNPDAPYYGCAAYKGETLMYGDPNSDDYNYL